ncbi:MULTISPECIES: hypothetical protein [Agrobacterium]|uniref:hypothetical protein n=1 Tax=Agrobacterium TaxID=357 RepID=UPI001574085E|nr:MULTISPECIES: hypothetical protein [Agrobacterium]MCD4659435.1 hypothetical protein [Agrobacterium sp.]NTE54385.1 hypothetical protein [Agrobacterium tumefaciens]NTE70550.1 hypothetical protein [Agrobacterium tumefaciens]
MKLFHTIHDAIEEHLPSVSDETDRQETLAYLRGLKSLLATVVDSERPNVIPFEDRLVQRRIKTAIAENRRRQLAAAHECVQPYGVDEFGWPIYAGDDID